MLNHKIFYSPTSSRYCSHIANRSSDSMNQNFVFHALNGALYRNWKPVILGANKLSSLYIRETKKSFFSHYTLLRVLYIIYYSLIYSHILHTCICTILMYTYYICIYYVYLWILSPEKLSVSNTTPRDEYFRVFFSSLRLHKTSASDG